MQSTVPPGATYDGLHENCGDVTFDEVLEYTTTLDTAKEPVLVSERNIVV